MEGISPTHSKTEYLRINETGDIIRDEEKDPKKKVMQVDDLPKETFEEMMFGKEKEENPIVKVENGRRLKDGKAVQNVNFDDQFSFLLSSVKFETLVFWGLVFLFLFFIFRKVRSISEKVKQNRLLHQNKQDRKIHIERQEINANKLDELIEYKVNEKLSMILLKNLN